MMSNIQVIGNILLSTSYRVLYDENDTGYVYIGLGLSGAKKSEASWAILRIAVTDNGKTTDMEWANFEGISNMDKIWDHRKDGTYSYNHD